MYNKWGGPVINLDASSVTDDDHSRTLDIDRASVKSLDETQQSWLLGAGEPKKKKQIDLGCVTCSRRMCCILVVLFLLCGFIAGLAVLIVKTVPRHHHKPIPVDNYTQALHKALLFFNAQKSGSLSKSNNISWRGNSGLNDGSVVNGGASKNLSGGYYDAGDNIKFGFPHAFSMTLLSWSVIEYRTKFQAVDEYDHIRELIKWGTDYIMKTYVFAVNTTNVTTIYAQVGQGTMPTPESPNDHYCWERPESVDYDRPAFAVSTATDLACEMSAALAAAAIVFRDDTAYSKKMMVGAASLYRFAEDRRGRYSTSVPDAASLYNSTSYWDEFLWAGAWLYYATGESAYLSRITNEELANHAGANGAGPYFGILSWDNKLIAAQLLMTRLYWIQTPGFPYEEVLKQYVNATTYVMCSYLPEFNIWHRTPGGLTYFLKNQSAPLQYTVNAAFLASLYADYLKASDVPVFKCAGTWRFAEELRNFSRSQIDYVLGKNPMDMSYVVGFGSKYPKQVHHRAASIPFKTKTTCTGGYTWRDKKAPNPNVINGAMVGGPNIKDQFHDLRFNWTYTEPTLAGNAALVGALIALSKESTAGVDVNTIFSALPQTAVSPPPPSTSTLP